MQTRILIALLVVAVVSGIGLRLWKLGSVPSGLFSDEIALALNAKLIHDRGKDEFNRPYPFGFESFSDYKLPGYVYTTALFLKFIPTSEFAVRLPSALAGILLIFIVGTLAKCIFPKRIYYPLAAMAVLAFTPFHIHFSRIAYESMLSLAFGMCAVLFSLKARLSVKSHWKYIAVASFFIISAMWTYHAMRLILPVWMAFYLLMQYFTSAKTSRQIHILPLSIIAVGVLAGFLPFILNPAIDARARSYMGAGSLQIGALLTRMMEVAGSYLRSFNLEFLFTKGDVWAFRHGTRENGVFPFLFIIPYLFGWIELIRLFVQKETRRAAITVIFMLLLFGVPSAITMLSPYGPRFLPMVIPLALLIALGVDVLIMLIGKLSRVLSYILVSITVLSFVYTYISYTHIYFLHFAVNSRHEFQGASFDLMHYLPKLEITGNTIYFLNERSCMAWGHDDMKLWYMRNLPDNVMTDWNVKFRSLRYSTGDAFNAYDQIKSPRVAAGKYILFTSHEEMGNARSGSFLIRCGVHLPNINTSKERIDKVFYLYDQQKRDPMYVVSQIR